MLIDYETNLAIGGLIKLRSQKSFLSEYQERAYIYIYPFSGPIAFIAKNKRNKWLHSQNTRTRFSTKEEAIDAALLELMINKI